MSHMAPGIEMRFESGITYKGVTVAMISWALAMEPIPSNLITQLL
jgi:hypothetical protein